MMFPLLFALIFQFPDFKSDPLSRFIDQTWNTHHYNVENGLIVNALTDVMQDSRGFIWIGSYDGLMRFDGLSFTYFDTKHYPIIPSNRFLYVVEAADGSIFGITERQQLIQIQSDSVNVVHGSDGEVLPGIHGISADKQGRILIASSAGLFRWSGNQSLEKLHDGRVARAVSDPFDRILFTDGETEIRVYQNGIIVEVFPYRTSRLHSLSPVLTNNGHWFGAFGSNFLKSDSTHVELQHFPESNFDVITTISADQNNRIYVRTETNGRYQWNESGSLTFLGGRGNILTQGDFLLKNGDFLTSDKSTIQLNGKEIWKSPSLIRKVIQDDEQNFWVATSEAGLFKLFGNKVMHFGKEEGLAVDNVYSVTQDAKGNFWLPTYQGPIYKLSIDGLEKVNTVKPAFGDVHIANSTLELNDGSIIFGTAHQGLLVVKGKNSFIDPIGNPSEIQGLYQDERGKIFLGTSSGIFVSKTNDVSKGFLRMNEGPTTTARVFRKMQNGTTFIGTTSEGLWRLNGDIAVPVEIPFIFFGAIREIFEDTAASRRENVPVLWIGTEGQGLFRVLLKTKPEVRRITSANELIDDTIHRIFLDDYGRFWIGTNKGVMVIRKAAIEAFASGQIGRFDVLVINEKNGMRNREVNSGGQSAGIKDSFGRFWFPTQKGFAIFNPALPWEQQYRTDLTLVGIKTESRFILPSKTIQLSSNERTFTLSWASPTFSTPSPVRFRHRLAGFENSWREQRGRTTFDYVNIPGGNYTFEVQRAFASGDWADPVMKVPISIEKRFYETIWFFVFASAFVLAIAYFFFRIIQLRNARARENLEKVIAKRTNELQKARDLTEQQAERLRKLDAARIAFLSSISHEMRTPLTLVVGPVKHLLENKESLPEELLNQLLLIDKNAEKLTSLLENLLDITRFESGAVQLQLTRVPLLSLVNESVIRIKTQVVNRKIHFKVQHPKESLVIEADPGRLSHVFDHVFELLTRFAAEDSTISVSTSFANGLATVSVHNSGKGIPEEELSKIFEIFFQVQDPITGKVLDSSIGLAFSKQIMTLHNSSIDLEILPDRSKQIVLSFPAEKENEVAADAELTFTPDSDAISLGNTEAKRILVVDDNEQIRKFVRLVLQTNYHILEAENGVQALEIAREESPDLIIADVMMPELDGVSMVRKIRQDVMLAGTPVVMLTAKDSVSDTVEGLEAGADVYLTKPFNAEVLKSQVSALLKTREMLKKNLPKVSISDVAKQKMDPFVAKVMDVIAANFNDPELNVEIIAEQLHIQRTQLFRRLKNAGDLTASKMILDFRMEKATDLLRSRVGNISEVAYACGFNSLSHFGKTFKMHFGINPKEWIEKNVGN